ncbi:MAG: ABC transporter permease [Candidatus Omnitrophica bacterium]|nr:ABC transporter permease [Candidatus Omnitrophota bacterium]
MNFLTFTVKDLIRRKIRYILTLLGITIGIVTCIIMLALSEGIRDSFKGAYIERNIDIVVFAKDEFNLLASRIDNSVVEGLKNIHEIENATGVILDIVKYRKSYVPVYGWPLDSPMFGEIKINGRLPLSGQREVLIGELFAQNSGKKIGDTLDIKRKTFHIVGIFQSDIPFEKSAFIVPLITLQRLDRTYRDTVVAINVTLKPAYRIKEKIDLVTAEIENTFPEVSAQSSDIFGEERTEMILMGEKFAQLVFLITLFAVILGLSNTMITSVFEKRKLMGLLMTIGWKKSDIMKSLFLQAFLLSIAGGILGVTIGFFTTHYIFNQLVIQIFTPSWDYLFVFKVIGTLLVVTVTASVISSWSIVNINPIEVIKSE